jgi:NADH-quinone oxidoreductase subunit M
MYSIPYMERRIRERCGEESRRAYATYYTLYLLYAVGVIGAVLATNLLELYLFFEVAMVSSWALIFLYGYGEREKIGLTYFIWTHIGAIFLLTGMLLAYWHVGSFEIVDLRKLVGHPLALWVGIAISLGIFVKMAATGLHAWLPNTYSEAPTPISATVGATSVCFGTYAVVRLLTPLRDSLFGISSIFELWALLTIVYGGLMALAQSDTKRLVAYLSMSQMNYCLLGAFTYVKLGVIGGTSYAVSHGLAIALLFLMSGSILYRTNTRDMNRLGGLAMKMPISIIAAFIGFFTIGGIPPTVGFKSKFMLLTGAFGRGFMSSGLELIVAVCATIAGILTISYEFWAIRRIFHGPLPNHLRNIKESPFTMSIPLFILSVIAIVLGVWPAIVTDPLEVAIGQLIGGH